MSSTVTALAKDAGGALPRNGRIRAGKSWTKTAGAGAPCV
jgi:hypothetical protein